MPVEIDILGHSCDVVRHRSLFEDYFDTFSFECVEFQRLSQIITNLTRETYEEREAEITNLSWTQKEKDIASAKCKGILLLQEQMVTLFSRFGND